MLYKITLSTGREIVTAKEPKKPFSLNGIVSIDEIFRVEDVPSSYSEDDWPLGGDKPINEYLSEKK